MIDGLEISEVYFSKIKHDQNERFDSHYYEKKYILLKQTLLAKPHWLLGDIVLKPIQTGHTPSMSNSLFYGGEIAFIKTDNLRVNSITTNFSNYLSNEGNQEISRTELKEKDIITTIIGATEDVIARTALVLPEHLPANINQNIVQIRVNETIVFAEYVNAYLNSRYGRDYLRYLSRQTEQVNLNCQEVSSVIVPKFSTEFQGVIRDCISKAYYLQRCSKENYLFADRMLEEGLGINQSSNDNISIKTFSESFNISGRLDAEYYQPKYEQYEEIIKNNKLGFTIIKKEFDLITKKCDRSLEQYPYIEIGDINVSTGVATSNIIMTEALPDNAKIMTKVNDVLVSTVRPNRGAVSILEEDDLLVSGAFTVLREKGNYPKEVLLVILRSELYRDWLLKYNVGTSYPVIKDDDILNLPLPILDEILNKEISDKVQESFRLRKESKKLLDIAIKAVEMAIETDEETAIAWMKEQGV